MTVVPSMNAKVSTEAERLQSARKGSRKRTETQGRKSCVCMYIYHLLPNMATRKTTPTTDETVTPAEIIADPTPTEVVQDQPTQPEEVQAEPAQEQIQAPEPEIYMVKENSRHLVTTEDGIGPFTLIRKTEKNGVIYMEFVGHEGLLFAEAMFFKTR